MPGDNIRPAAGTSRGRRGRGRGGQPAPAAAGGGARRAGVAEVPCARAPRVAVVATGSELGRPASRLRPGRSTSRTRILLGALIADAGGERDVSPVVADDDAATRAALADALEHDVVITTGGVSVGRTITCARRWPSSASRRCSGGSRCKPGKPIAFAVRGKTLVFGLPGNPVSSLVAFELFVRPALRALQGGASRAGLPDRPARARRPADAGTRRARACAPRGRPPASRSPARSRT